MKKKIILIAISLIVINYSFSQTSSLIVGNWIATVGNKTYEMTLVSQPLKVGTSYVNSILGRIVYKENGNITRMTSIDGTNSFLAGLNTLDDNIVIVINDIQLDVYATVEFTVLSDENTATWDNFKYSDRLMVRDNKIFYLTTETDLPKTMTFHRVTNP